MKVIPETKSDINVFIIYNIYYHYWGYLALIDILKIEV
jgi:hypothetical protein